MILNHLLFKHSYFFLYRFNSILKSDTKCLKMLLIFMFGLKKCFYFCLYFFSSDFSLVLVTFLNLLFFIQFLILFNISEHINLFQLIFHLLLINYINSFSLALKVSFHTFIIFLLNL